MFLTSLDSDKGAWFTLDWYNRRRTILLNLAFVLLSRNV